MTPTQTFGTCTLLLAMAMVGPAQAATGDLCSALKTIEFAGSAYLVNSRTGLIAVTPPPDLSKQSALAQAFGPRATETRYSSNVRLPGAFICFEILSQESRRPDRNFLRCTWPVGFNNGPKIVRDLVTSVGQCWPKTRRATSYIKDPEFTEGRAYVVRTGLDIMIKFVNGGGAATIDVVPAS
jgi:hypothetical protein